MGAEAGAKMRKDIDGGWPGILEDFRREAEARARVLLCKQSRAATRSDQ
jgi:hypothetical protein